MTQSSDSLDLSFIKSLFGSNKINDTSKPSSNPPLKLTEQRPCENQKPLLNYAPQLHTQQHTPNVKLDTSSSPPLQQKSVIQKPQSPVPVAASQHKPLVQTSPQQHTPNVRLDTSSPPLQQNSVLQKPQSPAPVVSIQHKPLVQSSPQQHTPNVRPDTSSPPLQQNSAMQKPQSPALVAASQHKPLLQTPLSAPTLPRPQQQDSQNQNHSSAPPTDKQQNLFLQNNPSTALDQWPNQPRHDIPQLHKEKKKEGKRQRINRTKYKHKVNSYKTVEDTPPDLDFDSLLAIHEKKTKAPTASTAAISKQEASFVSNLLDSLTQSATTQSESPSPNTTNSNKNKRKKNTQNYNGKKGQQNNNGKNNHAKKQKHGHSDLNAVHAMLSYEGNGQSATDKPSMVDIAHDIMGKPRKQPFNHIKRPPQQNGPKKPTTSDMICKYYLRGNCTSGTQCKFKHQGPQELTLCKFYKSGSCGNGANCTFSHDLQVEPCRFFFVNGGSCEAGDHCAFSHDPLTETTRKQLHRMTGPCRFYHFKGYCNNADQCGFSHTEIDTDEHRRLEQTLTPCRHYHTTGSCAKGDDCFFLHAEASHESVLAFKQSLAGKQRPPRPSNDSPRPSNDHNRPLDPPRPSNDHNRPLDPPRLNNDYNRPNNHPPRPKDPRLAAKDPRLHPHPFLSQQPYHPTL